MASDTVERLASNAWFTLIGRGSMVVGFALLAYLGRTLVEVQSDLKVLTNTVALNMSDRYRGIDAQRDLQIRDIKIDALKSRIDELAVSVNRIQK